MRQGIPALAVSVVALLCAAPASAAITSVMPGQTISGNPIPCSTQSDGVRVCHGSDGGGGAGDVRFQTFDGTALEIYVILPPAPASGPDGPYPLVVQSHGWGGSARGLSGSWYGPSTDAWAQHGYAVLQLSARGWGDSCGTSASRSADPAVCTNGYIHLDDERYEARDIQTAIGDLVDDGIADPHRIGVTGCSYGGAVSLDLATLKDRVMNPDGSLSPWTSPDGTPISIAAAAPTLTWSDFNNAVAPNGRTLDYQIVGATTDLSPVGVEKQSFVQSLYVAGMRRGFYGPPDATPAGGDWYRQITAGEPYDTNTSLQSDVSQLAQFNSPYYLLGGAFGTPSEAPAPLLIANGFTDDIVPVDEAVRYYNLERALYPLDPVTLFAGDFGHQRAQNKPYDINLLTTHMLSFFDHYVKGAGFPPSLDLTAIVETCPSSAPSGPTYRASSWSALHPGEVDYSSGGTQTIDSSAGDQFIAQTIDPVTGDGACATVSSADQGAGVATYRLPAASGTGYTLLGSPTVIADLQVTGSYPEVAARLWDVNPVTGTETLVTRGIYRPDPASPDGTQVFQLHPGAWHFGPGNIPKLELLGQDYPYARTSNGSFTISVSNLQLRLPVHEQPGSSAAVNQPLAPYR